MSPIRVLLVDDHYILREGVKALIETESEIEVIASASTAEEGLAKALENPVDVALIDYSLPDHDGVWLLARIQQEKPKLPVIVLSMHTGRDTVVRVLSAGASGYLPKSVDRAELLSAIRSAYRGGPYIHPSIAPLLFEVLRDTRQEEPLLELSERERHILSLAADGWTNQRIADELFLSISTIKADLRTLFQKLNASTRTEAVAEALRRGALSQKE